MSVKVLWKCGKKLQENSPGLWQYYLLPDNYEGAVKNNTHLLGTNGTTTFTVGTGFCLVKNSSYTEDGTTPRFWHVQNTANIQFDIPQNADSVDRYDSIVVLVDRTATSDPNGGGAAEIRYVTGDTSLGREMTANEILVSLGLDATHDIYRLYGLKITAGTNSIAEVYDHRIFVEDLYGVNDTYKKLGLTLKSHGVLDVQELLVLDSGTVGQVIVRKGEIFLPNRNGDISEKYVIGILPSDLQLNLTLPTNKRVVAIVAYNDNDPVNTYGLNVVPIYGVDDTTWTIPSASDIESQIPSGAHYSVLAYVYQDGAVAQYVRDARTFITLYDGSSKPNFLMNSDGAQYRFGIYSDDWSAIGQPDLLNGTEEWTINAVVGTNKRLNWVNIKPEPGLVADEWYLVHAWIEKTSGDMAIRVRVSYNDTAGTRYYWHAETETWSTTESYYYVFFDGESVNEKRFFLQAFKYPNDSVDYMQISFWTEGGTVDSVFKVSKIKLEHGKQPTPWVARKLVRIAVDGINDKLISANPQDVDYTWYVDFGAKYGPFVPAIEITARFGDTAAGSFLTFYQYYNGAYRELHRTTTFGTGLYNVIQIGGPITAENQKLKVWYDNSGGSGNIQIYATHVWRYEPIYVEK